MQLPTVCIMADIVFVLGAGTSRAAGAPLMSDFLDRAEDLLRSKRLESVHTPSFELVFKALSRLEGVHARMAYSPTNIEELFATFEMATILGSLGDLTKDEIVSLLPALRSVIAVTLEESVAFPVDAQGLHPPSAHVGFVSEVKRLAHASSVAILSFNYDVALDYAMEVAGAPPDYALGGDTPRTSIPLLKLHGSLNWGRCLRESCAGINPIGVQDWVRHNVREPKRDGERLRVSLRLNGVTHRCGGTCHSDPVIVPPTWSKPGYYTQLASVWQRAAEHLREARSVVVMGYSLPPTDRFFPLLYGLGSVGGNRPRRFAVCDPSEETFGRFENFLGPLPKERLEHIEERFEARNIGLTVRRAIRC